jgi:hypothetical protein
MRIAQFPQNPLELRQPKAVHRSMLDNNMPHAAPTDSGGTTQEHSHLHPDEARMTLHMFVVDSARLSHFEGQGATSTNHLQAVQAEQAVQAQQASTRLKSLVACPSDVKGTWKALKTSIFGAKRCSGFVSGLSGSFVLTVDFS